MSWLNRVALCSREPFNILRPLFLLSKCAFATSEQIISEAVYDETYFKIGQDLENKKKKERKKRKAVIPAWP